MTVCPRCGTVPLPNAQVCLSCCTSLTAPAAPAPVAPVAPAVPAAPAVQAASAALPPTTPEVVIPAVEAQEASPLASWPFGAADVAAAAQVAGQRAAEAAAANVKAELEQRWSAQDSTHVISSIPAQREAEPHSVPPVGPNPFLACVEGYPV